MDRFDFEQQILQCWRVTDDVKDVYEGITEGNLDLTQAGDILNGIRQMYELKFNKLWDLFEDVYMADVRKHTDDVRKLKMVEDECASLREQLAEKETTK